MSRAATTLKKPRCMFLLQVDEGSVTDAAQLHQQGDCRSARTTSCRGLHQTTTVAAANDLPLVRLHTQVALL